MENGDTGTQLKASLARLEATRAKQAATTTAAGPQLPLWSDKLSGLPNSLARGALFTCRGKAIERMQLSRVEIASAAGVRIAYTGLELRQDDQDVWLQIAHLARSHRLGIHVDITAYQLLKALGWGTGSKDYTRLRECFLRLTEGTVWVAFDAGREGFSGRLVDKIQWADAGSGQRERWRIKLDPSILHLFGGEDFALLDWQQRLGLSALAKWLHSFYSTHREPHPIGVARLYQLSGSANKRISGFRRELVGALDELQRSAFLHNWWIDPKSDLVSVRRVSVRPTHLERLVAGGQDGAHQTSELTPRSWTASVRALSMMCNRVEQHIGGRLCSEPGRSTSAAVLTLSGALLSSRVRPGRHRSGSSAN